MEVLVIKKQLLINSFEADKGSIKPSCCIYILSYKENDDDLCT